jgi:hypothetical protein
VGDVVYNDKVGIAVDTWEEIRHHYRAGEAGELFKRLMEYLRRLREGR